MNFPIQGTITAERGRITSYIPHNGGITIITERDTHHYPNGWLYPGFTDTHAHIFGLGARLNGIALYHCKSAEECIDILLSASPTNDSWYVGMGWNQELWNIPEFPNKKILDKYFPNNPVYLSRADGHAAWVNSAALAIANIHSYPTNPHGGSISIDEDGNPTGILIDNAMDLVKKYIPSFSDAEIQKRILSATKQCAAWGLTEVHDMDVHPRYLPFFREMAEAGTLPIRVISYVSAQNDEWDTENLLPAVGEFLQVAGIKFYADGALGSRGAAVLEQYSDAQTHGLFLIDAETLYQKAKSGLDSGWQIATHAIGDAANRMVLDVYEQLRNEGYKKEDYILRIEHAQIVHPSDYARFNSLGVFAAVQPIHCISDATMAEQRLAERCSYSYPYNSLLKNGTIIGGGSDFPIESGNSIVGLDAFIRRIPFNGTDSWQSHEKISRREALRAYTTHAHYLSGNEYRRGLLDTKFDADFTVLDTNILECAEETIADAQILATYTAGVRRFSNQLL